MDIEQARFNMIEQQIRPWDVLDSKVLDTLRRVRREHFISSHQSKLAFADLELALENGCAMWTPKLEARVVQEAGIGRGDTVLEIGTGSGYVTALLAALAGDVTSVEIDAEQSRIAAERLAACNCGNATLEVGDGSRGWGDGARFDVIVLTASTPVLPEAFQNSLNVGGRLLAIVGDAPLMTAKRIVRRDENTFESIDLFETCVAPLRNALTAPAFVF